MPILALRLRRSASRRCWYAACAFSLSFVLAKRVDGTKAYTRGQATAMRGKVHVGWASNDARKVRADTRGIQSDMRLALRFVALTLHKWSTSLSLTPPQARVFSLFPRTRMLGKAHSYFFCHPSLTWQVYGNIEASITETWQVEACPSASICLKVVAFMAQEAPTTPRGSHHAGPCPARIYKRTTKSHCCSLDSPHSFQRRRAASG